MSEHLGLDYGGRRTRRHDAPRKGKTFSDFVQKKQNFARRTVSRGGRLCAQTKLQLFAAHLCCQLMCLPCAVNSCAIKALALFPVSNDCLAQVADAGKV